MDEQKVAESQEQVAAEEQTHDESLTADGLIEEVSIDGMCGVY